MRPVSMAVERPLSEISPVAPLGLCSWLQLASVKRSTDEAIASAVIGLVVMCWSSVS